MRKPQVEGWWSRVRLIGKQIGMAANLVYSPLSLSAFVQSATRQPKQRDVFPSPHCADRTALTVVGLSGVVVSTARILLFYAWRGVYKS